MTWQDSFRQWDRSEWASTAVGHDAEAGGPRWNKFQWIGDRGGRRGGSVTPPEDMPEGENALSGFRHNPGTQHWSVGPGTDRGRLDRQPAGGPGRRSGGLTPLAR